MASLLPYAGGLSGSWADIMDEAAREDQAPPPPAASGVTARDLDLLAESSRDGINLLFKNVRGGP